MAASSSSQMAGSLAVIVGSAAAYIAIPEKQSSDLVRFLGATLASTLFFALNMYISQPR